MAFPRNKLTIPLPRLSLVRERPRFNLLKKPVLSESCCLSDDLSSGFNVGSSFACDALSNGVVLLVSDSVTNASVFDLGSTSSLLFSNTGSEVSPA
jgi:hypothetical protein